MKHIFLDDDHFHEHLQSTTDHAYLDILPQRVQQPGFIGQITLGFRKLLYCPPCSDIGLQAPYTHAVSKNILDCHASQANVHLTNKLDAPQLDAPTPT